MRILSQGVQGRILNGLIFSLLLLVCHKGEMQRKSPQVRFERLSYSLCVNSANM